MNNSLVKNIACFLMISLLFFACKKEGNVSESSVLEVGQHFGGGVIFYIDGSGEHGLVAAEQDVEIRVKWADTCCKTSASYQEIGRGSYNTTAIVNAFGLGDYAASACRQLSLNGYSDWFLPSKNELNLLFQKRALVGGFSTDYYWSSSEHDSLNAWYLYFPYGPQYFVNKDSLASVRAVRAF
jgi:hypothetical protein